LGPPLSIVTVNVAGSYGNLAANPFCAP